MSYDASFEIRALIASAPAALAESDPTGLEQYIVARVLDHSMNRPYSWATFVAERPDRDRVLQLVYDRPTGLVFTGGSGMHSRLCAQLHHLRSLDSSAAGRLPDLYGDLLANYSDHADAFITEGMGFRVGGPSAQMNSRTLMVGAEVRLTSAESKVFADYKLQRI